MLKMIIMVVLTIIVLATLFAIPHLSESASAGTPISQSLGSSYAAGLADLLGLITGIVMGGFSIAFAIATGQVAW